LTNEIVCKGCQSVYGISDFVYIWSRIQNHKLDMVVSLYIGDLTQRAHVVVQKTLRNFVDMILYTNAMSN
jgi:hypothetical protein